MLALFQNSGMLLLVILSFWFTEAKERRVVPFLSPQEKIIADSSLDRGEIVYIANIQKEEAPYGEFTAEIEQILSVTPDDSEIYLEEREGGKWYLKIEKLFSSENQSLLETPQLPSENLTPPMAIDEPPFTPTSYLEDTLLV
jgi:hypothetical protein